MNFTHGYINKYPMWWSVLSGVIRSLGMLCVMLVTWRDVFHLFEDRDDV